MNVTALSLFYVLFSFGSSETFYTVTSPKSDCPQEFIGKPCLTLKQYVAQPSKSTNVTLIMESGHHFLQWTRFQSGIYTNSFVMTAKISGANIVWNTSMTNHFTIYATKYIYIQINGITFIGSFKYFTIGEAQELIVESCNFIGVSFGLIGVTNATILGCTFSDYYYYLYDTIVYGYYHTGALSIQLQLSWVSAILATME